MNCEVSICYRRSVSYPSRGKVRILARTMRKVVFGCLLSDISDEIENRGDTNKPDDGAGEMRLGQGIISS